VDFEFPGWKAGSPWNAHPERVCGATTAPFDRGAYILAAGGEPVEIRADDLASLDEVIDFIRGRTGVKSGRFFTSVASYLDSERHADVDTDQPFVVLKGPRRGRAPSPCAYFLTR
jgi:hypothetical protein